MLSLSSRHPGEWAWIITTRHSKAFTSERCPHAREMALEMALEKSVCACTPLPLSAGVYEESFVNTGRKNERIEDVCARR